ncbi:MAG: hypothetical protein E7333_03000 [Clostridiales bacterium]|nr:hypothetical protein [Clostridiales bacterium]
MRFLLKKFLLLLMMLCLFTGVSCAEGFDLETLKADADWMMIPHDNGLDFVYRPVNQPFIGAVDGEGELIVYLDYVEDAQNGMVALRMLVSTALPEELCADTLALDVDGTVYTFDVMAVVSEYDRTYFEDYAVYFSPKSLPMLQQIARRKEDTPLAVTLTGAYVLTGQVILPGQEVADVFDLYVDLGGRQQGLSVYEDLYPVKITK